MKICRLFIAFSFILTLFSSPAFGEYKVEHPLGLPPVQVPANNPLSQEKIALGETLYFDTSFSKNGTVGCISCHSPTSGFADGKKVSEGIKQFTGTRNAPTVANAAYNKSQFWDGRAPSLEEQSKGPLINPVEHGLSSHEDVLKIISDDPDYLRSFKIAFGLKKEQITMNHVAMAIASFERTLVFGNSPFDRYFFGKEENAISDYAKKGFNLFRGKARCDVCHTILEDYALFTDHDFHNIGVGFHKISNNLKVKTEAFKKIKLSGAELDANILTNEEVSELGRFAVTLENRHIGAFKTPTLRNVALTAPYMHDGSIESLEEVIDFYDKGGEPMRFLVKSIFPTAFAIAEKDKAENVVPLSLTNAEKKQLLDFLLSLTSPELE